MSTRQVMTSRRAPTVLGAAAVPSPGYVRPLRLGLVPDDPRRALPRRRGADGRFRDPAQPPGAELPGAELQRHAPGRGARGGREPGQAGARPGAVGPGAGLGEVDLGRRPDDQRPGRGHLEEQRLQAAVRAAPVHRSPPTASTSGRRSKGASSANRGSSGGATASRSRSPGCGRSGTTRRSAPMRPASARARSSRPNRTT